MDLKDATLKNHQNMIELHTNSVEFHLKELDNLKANPDTPANRKLIDAELKKN